MATRATILIEGVNFAKVYVHWDGYPSHQLPWLKAFNKEFTNQRGEDPEYKFAQLLRHTVKMADEYTLDDSEFTGWGVVGYNDNCGAEYEYVLRARGRVTHKEL